MSLSLNSRLLKSISIPCLCFIDFRASSMTVNVFRPRASILIRPISAASSMSTATTGILSEVAGLFLVSIGAYLNIGSLEVTTPAAWIPVPRILPLKLSPYSLTSGYLSLNHATFEEWQ